LGQQKCILKKREKLALPAKKKLAPIIKEMSVALLWPTV